MPYRFIKTISLLVSLGLLLSGCGIIREDTKLPYESLVFVEGDYGNMTAEGTESETEAEPIPYEDVHITFTAMGDNLIHPNIYMEAGWRATDGTTHDFKPLYEEIAEEIAAADFAFINQETMMAGDDEFGLSGYPMFNSPQQLGVNLAELGFDIVSIANNHMLDAQSAAGLSSTIDFLSTQPYTVIGAYKNAEDAANIRTVESDGIKIALLAYTEHTNGNVLTYGSELDVPYAKEERILRDLAAAEEIADFTIVSIHWGEENTKEPDDEQRRLAGVMADNGADVILGHHSHTLLPLEWIEREDGGRTLCAYSLGNLVSAMMYPENMVGGLLGFAIVGDGKGGLTVDEISFTPTVFYYGMNHFGTHIYRLENYTEAIAAGHGTQMYGYTTTYEKAVTYLKRCFADEYLPEYLRDNED
ncbi:MAG: CapA family protein [Clostridia bacterium]|nr:CapA family protein [Clostridia bacterium]